MINNTMPWPPPASVSIAISTFVCAIVATVVFKVHALSIVLFVFISLI